MFDLNNYQRVHNLAVDMCVACIIHERKFRRAIKSISLRPKYYGFFKKYVAANAGEERAENSIFEIDGVEIKQGSRFQVKLMELEHWPAAQPAQA